MHLSACGIEEDQMVRKNKAEIMAEDILLLYDAIMAKLSFPENGDYYIMAISPQFLSVKNGVLNLDIPNVEDENVETVEKISGKVGSSEVDAFGD